MPYLHHGFSKNYVLPRLIPLNVYFCITGTIGFIKTMKRLYPYPITFVHFQFLKALTEIIILKIVRSENGRGINQQQRRFLFKQAQISHFYNQ
jgi:hypothetical protein